MENISKDVAPNRPVRKWLPIIGLFLASALAYPYPSWISICETTLRIEPPFTSDWALQIFLIFHILITGIFWSEYGFVLAAGPPLLISSLSLFCFRFLRKNKKVAGWLSTGRLRKWSIFLMIWSLSVLVVFLFHIFVFRRGIFDIQGFCTKLKSPLDPFE